jgi:hypothetical protein
MKSMRTFLILASAFFLTGLTAHAQSDNAGDHAIPDRSYQLLREDENWTFLRNRALRQDFWDPIKYIPSRNRPDDWYLTIGGEAREVWEQIGNDNWGQQPYMNGYLNERYMLSFDAHYGKHVRSFVEFKSGLTHTGSVVRDPSTKRSSTSRPDFSNLALPKVRTPSHYVLAGRNSSTAPGA